MPDDAVTATVGGSLQVLTFVRVETSNGTSVGFSLAQESMYGDQPTAR